MGSSYGIFECLCDSRIESLDSSSNSKSLSYFRPVSSIVNRKTTIREKSDNQLFWDKVRKYMQSSESQLLEDT